MYEFETGSTIRLKAQFRNWAPEGETGEPVAPDSVVVNIYDSENTLIKGPEVPLNDGVGLYHYYWIMPSEPGSYFVEFKGMVDGRPQLRRLKIKTKWNVKDE